jgi:NAD-dependent SIR2 family protein deacetylase
MTYTTTLHCGNEHSQWLKNISFYDDDLDTLEGRLIEIVKKNNSHEAMAGVEHFQNQFIVQRNNIDELRHSINVHSDKVAGEALVHGGKMQSLHVSEHESLREQYESFEKVIKELRHDFNIFLSKWM